MKKIMTAFLLLLLSVMMPLAAADLEAEGSGATMEEAVLNAKQNLSTYLSVNISSSQDIRTVDDGQSVDSVYSENISSKSSVRLFGMKTTTPVKKNGVWTAKAYIAEKEKKLYLAEINRMKPILENIDMEKTGSREELIEYYSAALYQYIDWELYVRIYTILTDDRYPVPELPITKNDITSRYNTLLKSLDSALEQEEFLLREKEKRGQLSEEDRERKEAIMREKEDVKGKIDAFLAQQDEEKRSLEEQADARTKQYLDKLRDVKVSKPRVDIADPVKFILGIEDYRNVFSATKRSLAEDMDGLWEEFSEAAGRMTGEIMSAKNMTNRALMDPDGLPSAEYIEKQMDNALVPEIEKLFRVYYENAWKMYDATSDSLEAISKEAEESIEILRDTSFSASRFGGEISPSLKFDLNENVWSGVAWLEVAGQEVSIPFEIPLDKLTGEEIDDLQSSEKWLKFNAELEAWHSILVSSDLAYDVSVTYHIEGSLESNVYMIVVDSIKVTNPLEKGERSILYEAEKEVKVQSFTLSGNRTDMSDFVTENRFEIRERMPKVGSVSFMPESKLDMPELPEIIEAERFSDDDLPKGEVETTEMKKIAAAGAGRSWGLTFGGRTGWTEGGTENVFDLGFSWKTAWPVFADTRFRLGVYSSFMTDFAEELSIGGGLEMSMMSYVDSLTYILWGIGADALWNAESHDVGVAPMALFGLGGETGTVDAEVAGFAGCAFSMEDGWSPRLAGGFRFRLSWLIH